MKFNGSIQLGGDKSISIRMILFSILSGEGSQISNVGRSRDVKSAIRCIEGLGLNYCYKTKKIIKKKVPSSNVFDCDNSATTARLLIGLLIGKKVPFKIIGDKSLMSRPMMRVIRPMMEMGVKLKHFSGRLPIETTNYDKLNSIRYELPVASAQLKSCIILASLGANGKSEIIEQFSTRKHTERILKMMGAKIEINKNIISTYPSAALDTVNYYVPGDVSSAAFLIQLAILGAESSVTIKKSLISKDRIGFIEILKAMNANIEIKNEYIDEAGESVGDIIAKSSNLNSVVIDEEVIPSCIDEVIILATCASQARGQTVIKGVEELKHKESNRLELIVKNLKKMNADISTDGSNIVIRGGKRLYSTTITTNNDHRIFMAFYVLSLAIGVEVDFDTVNSFQYSYPNFTKDIKRMVG